MQNSEVASGLGVWFAERYGSRRGVVLTWTHKLRYLLGGYRNYRRVDWKSAERLVFVCKGNICRSAYAEAVAHSLGLEAISCGIDTSDGAPANSGAVRVAAEKGIDLTGHRTRPIQSLVLRKNDLLIAMEPWQARYLERQFDQRHECTLLGIWGKPVRPHIHDPFGASEAYFNNCFTYIEKSVHEITRKVSATG